LIDNIRIYNRVLTSPEIQTLYDEGGWDSTPPAKPTNLTSTPGNTQIRLKWSQNSENDFAKYIIYGGTLPSPTARIDSTISVSDTTKTVTGLTTGVTYYYRITAVDSAGNESEYSNEISATPPNMGLSSYVPTSGIAGTEVVIYGVSFRAISDENIVTFGGIPATVLSSSFNSLNVEVPAGVIGSVEIVVNVGAESVTCSKMFTVIPPGSGNASFSPQQIISTLANGARSVYVADLDGDGDLDVLSSSYYDDEIAWYENTGNGTFGSQQIISTLADGAYSVYAADLDGDGDLDVLSASATDDEIAWYENTGSGTFGSQQIISTLANGARSVYAADLDGDGDLDVLSASYLDDEIAWYENTTSAIIPSVPQNLTALPGNEQVDLIWSKNSESNVTKYYIYYRTDLISVSLIDSCLSINDTTKTIVGLANGTNYYFKIKAVTNNSVESDFSDEINSIPRSINNEGLVAYYPFDGDSYDRSGNGNDGIEVGVSPAVNRYNISNSAYSFDGDNNYIDIDSLDYFSEYSFTYTSLGQYCQ